jgi:exodeoxyribonuclease VII large subunit
MNRELPISPAVQRIAVISSSKAAGWQDFRNELFRYGYAFDLTLFEATMQGEGAEESIISALERIATNDEQYDAVAIIRGGGSTSDLNCYNSYRLASHVAQFPLPVITGIGHDKDVSVTDMIAHTMLKTPTAVAVWLNDRLSALEQRLDNAALQLHEYCLEATHRATLHLERQTTELRLALQRVLTTQNTKIEILSTTLHDNVFTAIDSQSQRLAHLSQPTESQSPERIMRLGFAVARIGGKAIISCKSVSVGDIITLEVADGKITSKIVE